MKLLRIVLHFEYRQRIMDLLDDHDVSNYTINPMIEGKDHEGKHFGSKVHPGNVSVISAQLGEEQVDQVMDELKKFKHEKTSHHHLQALILPVDSYLPPVDSND